MINLFTFLINNTFFAPTTNNNQVATTINNPFPFTETESNLEKACKNSNLIEYKPLGQLGEYTLNDTIITLSTLKTYFIIYIDNLKITNAPLKLIKRNTNCKYLCYKSNIYFRFIYKWYKQLRVNNIKDTYLSFLLYIFYF